MNDLQQIAHSLESLIDLIVPETSTVSVVTIHPGYVRFAVVNGRYVLDPSGRLEPGRRGTASVTLHRPTDIDPELFADWLRQAVEIEAIAA